MRIDDLLQGKTWSRCFMLTFALALITGCTSTQPHTSIPHVETLVPGTPMKGIQGLAWGPDGMLYAAALTPQTIHRVDPRTGAVELLIDAPAGESDDVAVGPDGTLVWTAMRSGEVRIKRPGGPVEVLAENMPIVNPVAFTPDGSRVFVVTLGDPRALWELYLDGTTPPRMVTDQIKGLNSFEIDDDGFLYGPYLMDGELVKVNIDTGDITSLGTDLGFPVAVELDSQGDLIWIDFQSGEVHRTDPLTGDTTVLTTVEAPLDNLAVAPDDTIYVSESAKSGITKISPDGKTQSQLVGGAFSTPGGLDIGLIDGQETLVVADIIGYRFVDPSTGAVTFPPYSMTHGNSTSISVNGTVLALTDGRSGRVQLVDLVKDELLILDTGFQNAYGVAWLKNGEVLFVEHGAGQLTKWTPTGSVTVTDCLRGPVGLTVETETTVLVAENTSGSIARVELVTGAVTRVFSGLASPEGLDVMADGRIAVAEVGAARVVAIDLESGALEVLADGLSFGVAASGAPESVGFPTGIAVGSDGAIYVSEDGANAIRKITFE